MRTFWGRNKLKYGNRKKESNGILYDSRIEANYANDLLLMKAAKEIKDFEPKPKYDLYGKNGSKICTIVPDFLVTMPDGTFEIHEVKSKITMTPLWNFKRKLFEDNFPELPYRTIIF